MGKADYVGGRGESIASMRLDRICRLGLSSRGNTNLTREDVHFALDRGVNYLNWCGTADNGMNRAIAELGPRRADVVICAQFEARTAADAAAELADMLGKLRTDYVDVLTFYYVEEPAEWQEIAGPGGALEYCMAARRDGRVRLLGLTSHQRRLAASVAQTRRLDLLMIRYNAAHRGAETDIFPVTGALRMPVVAYTALRWGALLRPTPDDPPGFVVPRAPDWYRFVLQVAVGGGGPDGAGRPGRAGRGPHGTESVGTVAAAGIRAPRRTRAARAEARRGVSLMARRLCGQTFHGHAAGRRFVHLRRGVRGVRAPSSHKPHAHWHLGRKVSCTWPGATPARNARASGHDPQSRVTA